MLSCEFMPSIVILSAPLGDRKSTRLNSSHEWISYAVFCLKKKKKRAHENNNDAQTKVSGDDVKSALCRPHRSTLNAADESDVRALRRVGAAVPTRDVRHGR